MKQSRLFAPTLRDVPSDAEAVSHQLMLRSGYIRQVASGVYAYLPLARRVLTKIETVIREEMNRIDSVEMTLPALIPADLWKETGRYNTYGEELVKLKDRHDRDFVLGPTHEETFADLIRNDIKSYKKLPLSMYQIQTKYRDEKRPRFGLLRGREFIMKDAYTFHEDYDSLDKSYDDMLRAYLAIFDRLELDYRAIIGDAGAMGGRDSMEFMALSDAGEDIVVYSNESDYAANLEMAESYFELDKTDVELKEIETVDTPGTTTMEKLANFLNLDLKDTMKSVMFMVDEETPVMAITRGDHNVNEVKVRMAVDGKDIQPATDEEIKEIFKVVPGFAGPVGINPDVTVIVDQYIKNIANSVTGANEENKHLINVNPERDFGEFTYADIRVVEEGEGSPDGKGQLVFQKGIEIGHIFKLGTFYSESMDATVLDSNGRPTPVVMGSYGIGVSRLLSAIIEQNNDDKGIVWPESIAPFDVHLIPIKWSNDKHRQLAEELEATLIDANLEVLIDDRNERPGVKFTDAELMGVPYHVTIGKKASEGIVEVASRATGEMIEAKAEDIVETLAKLKK